MYQRIDVERRPLDLEAYKLRGAKESDCSTLVTRSTGLFENGQMIVAYWELDDQGLDDLIMTPQQREEFKRIFNGMEWALPRIHYTRKDRTNGMYATTRVFGYQPRIALRRDFCTATTLATEAPEEHQAIADGSKIIDACYRSLHPDLYRVHHQQTDRVLADYHLEDSPFTSGIINDNNPLPYHYDAGNFRQVWSGMLVFKFAIAGGYLNLPEFDLAIQLKHRSLLMFDGQGILHGVTPIQRLTPEARRFSIVYYSLAGMWNCAPLSDELVRIRKLRTEREASRLAKRRENAEQLKREQAAALLRLHAGATPGQP